MPYTAWAPTLPGPDSLKNERWPGARAPGRVVGAPQRVAVDGGARADPGSPEWRPERADEPGVTAEPRGGPAPQLARRVHPVGIEEPGRRREAEVQADDRLGLLERELDDTSAWSRRDRGRSRGQRWTRPRRPQAKSRGRRPADRPPRSNPPRRSAGGPPPRRRCSPARASARAAPSRRRRPGVVQA